MRRALAGALLLLAAAAPARAETFRLDDSMSVVTPPAAEWEWMPFGARGANTQLQMNVRVLVRIDTRAWVGRTGRIYMVLPLDPGGSVTATWESRGPLAPGQLVSGERALVHSGVIATPSIEDTLAVRLTTDARLRTVSTRRLAFHFELETP
jgi:hypothetical protein